MKPDESEPDDDLQEEDTAEESDDDDVDETSDNVGDPSVEINVEELIHELEVHGLASNVDREISTRRRLEELIEKRRSRRDLEDFDDYDV